MSYRAALPMYDMPEVRTATERAWRTLSRALPEGTKVAFERPQTQPEMVALLADPACILSQTCWGPITLGELPDLTILAQPDYGPYPGCRGPLYRSAVIATGPGHDAAAPADAGAQIPDRTLRDRHLAFNEPASLSGYLSLTRDTPMAFGRETQTGSHRASVQAVATGAADIAAIDARTFTMLRAHDPLAAEVHVIGWTALRMGLPFVANPKAPAALTDRLRAALIAGGAHPPGETPPPL